MSLKTRILALLGQARLYATLGNPSVCESCLCEVERLLPSIISPVDFLNLYLAFKKVELYLLPTIEGDSECHAAM